MTTPPTKTYGELYGPAMEIQTAEAAATYFEELVQYGMSRGQTRQESERIQRERHREEALVRQTYRDARTITDQLRLIAGRPGKSKREVARLTGRKAAA